MESQNTKKTAVKASHDQVSDYSDDWGDDSPDKGKGHAKEMKEHIENKNAIKQLQEKRAVGKGAGLQDDDLDDRLAGYNEELDDLWTRVREFLSESELGGAKKDPKNTEPTKLRFLNACETRDPAKKGVFSKRDLMLAFTAARLSPMLTDSELDKLITALDAWDQREKETVSYRRFLEAPYSREVVSMHGIFPKILPRNLSKYEQEKKAKADQEERKKQLEDQEAERLKREQVQAKKSVGATRSGLVQKPSTPTKEDLRRSQREEQLQKEVERKEVERLHKHEEEEVKKEAAKLKSVVGSVQIKARQQGDVRKWFNLFDSGSNGRLELRELNEVLVHAGARLTDREVQTVFTLLDRSGNGRIAYSEFCDVIDETLVLDYTEFVRAQRKKQKEEGKEVIEKSSKNINSRAVDVGSVDVVRDEKLGHVDGLSQIMRTAGVTQTGASKNVRLTEDNHAEVLRVQNEIKEHLRSLSSGKPTTFDDLLQIMGRAPFSKENQVTLSDFQQVVHVAAGAQKFSAHEIRQVFHLHTSEDPRPVAGQSEPFIALRVFKDKFLPGLRWTNEARLEGLGSAASGSVSGDGESASQTASLAIDHILQGKRPEDLAKEQDQQKRAQEKKVAQPALVEVREENDAASQDSRMSKPIEQIVEAQTGDPKKKNAQKMQASLLSQEALREFDVSQKVNRDFYRQPEAVLRREPTAESFQFDKSLERALQAVCARLIEELSIPTKQRELQSYVDHYGRESPGFLHYSEFKEIYMTHVHKPGAQPPEEAKLLALFNLFDVQSRGKIARQDFEMCIQRARPAISLVERIGNKVRKGGDRLIRVLTEEFQEADAPFGCNGFLPLNNFQIILADYDLPLVQADLTDLEKRGYLRTDDTGNRYIDYNSILKSVGSKSQSSAGQLAAVLKAVVKLQSAWRGRCARILAETLRRRKGNNDLNEVGEVIDALTSKEPQKGKQQKGDKVKGSAAKDLKQKELEKRKREAARAGKDRVKEGDQLESKMTAVIRPSKDNKLSDKVLQARRETSEFIRSTIIEHMIEAAFCYGESLSVGRTIQKKYENRPVVKYLFPMIQEFQFSVQGALPKSLHAVNQLGQIVCLDAENQLRQYDVATVKSLQSVNLGTRPPLKHYNIIDSVYDQTSGRIYTLNANWILEIWSIDQNASFPQKRLPVCANEGGKDFINLYYKSTFNKSKPKFLSLQDSNQQILVVNTTCVDGSIVFIDPISFSILKKIQFRYSDYEVPKAVRESIRRLHGIFEEIRINQGKDVAHIFADITNRNTQEVKVRDLVAKLIRLDSTLQEEDMFKCCRVLDTDGSDTITLDEFLEYFGDFGLRNSDSVAAEEELEDEMWPEWLIKEGELPHAQTLLSSMHSILEHEHGISAEQAFGIYDIRDSGECSTEEFKRVLKIFFGEVIPKEADLDFLVRLANKSANQRIEYREFCKFLSKRMVRTFKLQGAPANDGDASAQAALGTVQRELERPLSKEATMSYALRKSAELHLDLRKILVEFDKNELNVIPRSKFIGILMDLPLGLAESEIHEILENDLHFDNYGNVDYTIILNSDLFCHLERQRLKTNYKKRKGIRVSIGEAPKQEEQEEAVKVDNRKVVIEDLIYIDDLEIIVYTTIAPKTSSIFITSAKKAPNMSTTESDQQVLTLENVGQAQTRDKSGQANAEKQKSLLTNQYALLAKLKGHRNSDPPSICYVPHSCCLISGEKHQDELDYVPPKSSFPAAADPTVPASHNFQKSKQSSYEKHSTRGQIGKPCEILIWNLQKDLIQLFQSRPPWNMPCHRRIQAHNSSIIDICYLEKSQLVVTASTDQTIKFFDPVSTSYELTDPSNSPHAMMRPGHYKPLEREVTRSNLTLKEVKRIYTGSDTSCFTLRCLNIQNIAIDRQNPELKSQLEWLVALKLGKPQFQQSRNTQVGFICGYGIERVQIEVPAIHTDDTVPPFVLKECEELVTARRRKLLIMFQQCLSQTISKIFSQVQLQESYISRIRSLFMKAILQRKELKYVNPEPLREIYQLILKLPDRSKFQSFLASSGCSDKLSVSETFFYLQKFQQIHPLRTTQIEFERSIQEFHDKHQRQFLKGVKKWPKQSVQRFADHIRRYGLDQAFLQQGNKTGKSFTSFCTRERFIQYFEEVVNKQGENFSDLDIDSILNDLDPFYTGVVQLRLLQKVYADEIQFYKRTSLSRPNEILEDIRNLVFPNKRVALQQSLASADTEGDGYLLKDQFILAFHQVGVNIDLDTLEFLFDVMSEAYTLPKTNYEPRNDESQTNSQEKIVSLNFFMNRLFRANETRETDEVEEALSHVKASLIYKGLDFSIVFAEQTEESLNKGKRQATKKSKEERQQQEEERKLKKKKQEQSIDMTSHYTRFAQQLVKEEFCRRVESLNAPHLTPQKIQRLATFLALNQKNQTIIYLNSWLHHLRRANTAFQEADRRVLPLICSKLIRNEKVFRSWLESCGHIRGKREEEKFIQLADLRQVLTKFGVSYINQDVFLKDFTKGDQVHIEDLITRVKSMVRQHYQSTGAAGNQQEFDPQMMTDLRKTDYFTKVHQAIRATGITIDTSDLIRQFKTFDSGKTGVIKVYLMINVLKHNYPEVFSEDCLLGLQFQLECLSGDGTVDYEEFSKIFLEDSAKGKPAQEIRLDRKSPYNIQDYEDLLSKINSQVKQQGLDLMRIFEIFCKQGGFISFNDLAKIFELIEFIPSEHQFELIKRYADENNQGTVLAYEFVNQILFSKEIAPSFDVHRWTVASRELLGRYQLLETVQGSTSFIKDQLIARYGDAEGKHCGVLTAQNFAELLGAECPSLSESEKQLLCLFAVKGSRRIYGGEQPTSSMMDMKSDLVQFYHFDQAIEEVIQNMRRESIAKEQDLVSDGQTDSLAKFRQQIQDELKKQQRVDAEHFRSAQSQRMQALKSKVVSLFLEKEVSFFDCFQSAYDSLNPKESLFSISEFKRRLKQLNLPLSVMEHRLLRRIADPQQIGKVDIRSFCQFFETAELRQRRLNKILDKVATAFFLQGFNMRRAFALFDADGDGAISAREFRQGMSALNLHLRFDEIDDLMHLCDKGGNGQISYDEFISKMDVNLKKRHNKVMEKVEQAFFERLGEAIEYSRETLYEMMQTYDFEQDGTIDAQDLCKVIKKLGIMNAEQNLPILLKAGGGGEKDKRVSCIDFSDHLEKELISRKRAANSVHEKQLQKITAILKSKGITLFEFFVMLDVNQSGRISRLEFKTGVQLIGLTCTTEEFDYLWNSIFKRVDKIKHKEIATSGEREKQRAREIQVAKAHPHAEAHSEAPGQPPAHRSGFRLEPGVEQVSYLCVIESFAKAGCLKLQDALDHRDALLGKFRAQLKKMKMSVEKVYKQFDPNNLGSVQKKDFLNDCVMMSFQFSEEELVKLFECICEFGTKKTTSNDQQTQQLERGVPTAYTRFSYRQLQDAVMVQRDENWLYQACIKIHSVILQKGFSYKRLFTQWRDKQSKTTAGRLNEKELTAGLKKLKAGLTTGEIEKLCGSLQYEGKDQSFGAADFEKFVMESARKLESERSFQRMLLQDWIGQFNDCVKREGVPIERLFYEHDSEQVGTLNFENFAGLNEQLGLCMPRKDLQRIFGILDRQTTKRIRMDDLKSVTSLVNNEGDKENDLLAENQEDGLVGLSGQDLIKKQELNDIYEKVKETLESLNLTIEQIVYAELKYMPNQLATTRGIQQVFERLSIILTKNEVERVLNDVREGINGKFECSFKDFVDSMTRKRINVAFVDKGFIDPLIAQCSQNMAKAKDAFGLTFDQLFGIFDGKGNGLLSKADFLICIQGLELEIAVEDIMELFNYMDDKGNNSVSKLQFVDALTYITSKLGGQSFLDAQMTKGVSQTKKGQTNRQAMLNVLNNVADAIHQKQLQMRQVIQLLDGNGTGFVTRAEFSQVMRGLCETISLEQSRLLLTFFDDRGTGKISVPEVVGLLQDLLNQQIGGGIYAFMQVKPVIQKIINGLAIDADKFFDELAYLNDELLKVEDEQSQGRGESAVQKKRRVTMSKDQICGLSKRLFFNKLAEYGVFLSEQDKAQICQVFDSEGSTDRLDYLKLDQAFEGEQQHLYALEQFYTVEWERRVFKKIGEYLQKNNYTIEHCFDLIDDDGSKTISLSELKQVLIRFELKLSDRQIQIFLDRVGDAKGFISREAFIMRFWSAYTYENLQINDKVSSDATSMLPGGNHISGADRGRIANGLHQKLKTLKMLKAIQEQIKYKKPINEAFECLDSGVGFLTMRDFQVGLSMHFDLTLRHNELITLFLDIDTDGNGIVKYAEFSEFYRTDYDKRVRELEEEKKLMVTHYDVFDHLLKILKQKGLTLEEMFDQIDLDKNQFIEVDEFHQVLESMGFLITEEQVFELMRQMDENFDGRISYIELKQHILKLGFAVDKTLESRNQDGPQIQSTTFMWRDKGIELIIQALNRKEASKSYEEYFKDFDFDHDGHLSPSEFRQAIIALKEQQLRRLQIERILHILLEEKKSQALISIERMGNFLRSYKCLDEETGMPGGSSLLIDEDLFVYIVERYDGFSRLVEQFNAVEERAHYISKHTHELNLRGLDMLSNQINLAKIHRRALVVNGLYDSTLVLLAGEANRLIRDEAQLCVLDPTYSINTIVNDQNVGALSAVSIPLIENSQFDIDYNSMEVLPSGAQRFQGLMAKQRKKVEVLIYPNEYLSFVSADGKVYKRHLQQELQVHRYLMGAHFEVDEELNPETMEIFPNVGKFEKKIGLAANDKEIYIVNELVNQDEWISLDDFVTKNGGILNIPLFYRTDAPLFIIRHWAKMILKIIQKVHDVSAVLRCLNLQQVWVSRDGQQIKLGHVRGVGKTNNFGYISSCPDIYLNLENNGEDQKADKSQSQAQGQKVGGAASSSKKTDGVRHFSNTCLDNPFIAPETLCLKFLDQSSALDVWSFGMIMYCLLLGKKPQSFYSVYRAWYKKCHGHDVEMAQLPFIPPSQSNFLYDPFAVDFENPFDAEDDVWNNTIELSISGSLKEKKEGSINFENFIKCLKDMSYSSLFTQENSKKFYFKSVAEQIQQNQSVANNQPPRFPGQQNNADNIRLKAMKSFAKAAVLARKNELGLILDLISSCLDVDPKRRPTIPGLINSPLFNIDSYEMTKAVRFSQNVILYRSPQNTVSMQITAPLRNMCALAIKQPERLMHIEADILRIFAGAEECVAHISTLPLDEINEVLTAEEKRRFLLDTDKGSKFKGKDYSRLRVSPNSPLAAQLIQDKVIDMLIFLALRYTKAFTRWKQGTGPDHDQQSQMLSKPHGSPSQTEGTRRSKSTKQTADGGTERTQSQNQQGISKKRSQNHVLRRLTQLVKTLVYEMHSYSTPMAPFAKEVTEYVVKLFVGEEYQLGSDAVLQKTAGSENSLQDYLRERSFFQKEENLGEKFKSDYADKSWYLEQRNLGFLDKSNHWSLELHQEANKIYKDAITEAGQGQSCYPVLNDFITNVSNSFEPSKIFSKQMNQLSLSFLIPMNRTSAYYNELIPITECLSRLYSPDLEKAGKRCALAMIRSVFQTGKSDKIKACLDMRVPKHIIHFLQDSDSDVRKECLLTLLEISKGLQDEDFEIMGKSAANLKQEYSRRGFKKTAFDQHKAISMASQSEAIEADQDQDVPMADSKQKQKKIPPPTAQGYSNYINRTIALIEKNENERFINFALDLPNLNFLASKRFLREMAVCFESPVFIAPLTRLLKGKTETFPNKEIILQIMENLFCGNERVLTAVNSPASDTYMTLLRLLMQNTKLQNARGNPSGLSSQMRNHLALQDKAIELFQFMFEQRRPTIIRDLSCIGASSTLLRDQGLRIPELISLPIIVAFFDDFSQLQNEPKAEMIIVKDFVLVIKDLRCWVKHFYDESSIPELTRIKALQRCCNFLIRVIGLVWEDYKHVAAERRLEYLLLIKTILQFLDWLCIQNKENFIFNEESGRQNIQFVLDKCTTALSQFRAPLDQTQLPLEDLAFNHSKNKQIQALRQYDMFPFTEIGAILQNILYQLVRKDSKYINQLLSEANFGFIFGEQLILEYDFIRHCIDNKIESMVLIDSYVKKNEIRLNTFEYLLRSSEETLKDELLASGFTEALFGDYISDFREFNIQFSKIDLEFLAFRRSYPIRLECISLVNTVLMLKPQAPRVFTELVMYARRHSVIKQELDVVRRGRLGSKESTCLLLFAIILESNEEDLINVMMQDGAAEVLKQLLRDNPSVGRKFPVIAAFTSPF